MEEETNRQSKQAYIKKKKTETAKKKRTRENPICLRAGGKKREKGWWGRMEDLGGVGHIKKKKKQN